MMTPYFKDSSVTLYHGNSLEVLKGLPAESVNTCVTSPPYFGLRDYGIEGQLGLEPTPDEYVEKLVAIFREVKRVLRGDGTVWLNLGDSYANDSKWGGSSGGKHVKELHGDTGIGRGKKFTGLKGKDLIGIPWMVAFALRADGWYLRSEIIWAKPNPMPESVTDRPTRSHEQIFLLSKSQSYYYDAEAVREGISESTVQRWGTRVGRVGSPGTSPDRNDYTPNFSGEKMCGVNPNGRNRRSVWTVAEPMYRLRSDLTPEQRALVLRRIAGADSL